MAEVLVLKLAECVVSETVTRLADLLIQEAVSLSTVKDDVGRLKDELARMFSFLRDADTKQENDLVRTWIQQVTNLAHDIEDVIEIFISKVKSSNFITKPVLLHNLRNQITLIQTRVKDIFDAQKNYGIQPKSAEQARSFVADRKQDARRTDPDLDADEDEFVNLEKSTKELKAHLTREEDELSIVSVVGMGGLGKTTLAKRVYNQIDVKKRFDCCAWVFVSQQYQPRDILSDILLKVGWGKTIEETRKARETLRQLEERDMISHLNQVLKERRYLVVLDDIWDIGAWNSVRKAFPNGKKGSKVMFTTRNEGITELLDLHNVSTSPPFLDSEQSFELLRKKAFQKGKDGNYSCPPELDQLGRQMADECKGLPLALVVLGGLLKMKKSADEWSAVKKDLKSQLNKRGLKDRVDEILALSYYDLPYDLKPFFLYVGNFPEDREIPKRKLIRLWLAEGFMTMPTSGNQATPIEDVAEQFLEELIDRNIVQVAKRDHTGVGVKTCRVHDLMRDLAQSKAKEDNFCGVMQLQHQMNPVTASSSSSTTARRIAVYFGSHLDHKAVWVSQLHPHLRSLLCFDISALSLLPLNKEQFELLRVLELGFSRGKNSKCKMSKKIGDLIHLKYLGLRAAGISELPSTIDKLQNLLTLDVRDNDGVILPGELSKLRRLIHLLMPLNAKASHVRIDKLTSIETLKFVEAADLIGNDAKSTLVHVRNLGIQFKNSKEAELIINAPIVNSGRLRSLTMSMPQNDSFSSLQPLTDCTLLSKLDVTGKIPSGLQFLPPNLTKLVLERSELKQDPMKVLEKLQKLKFLRLGALSYKGDKLVCSAEGFPSLETLQLNGLFQVEEWRMERSAMKSLKRLDIEGIPQLRMLPEEILYVITLQELNVSMHQSFGDRLKGEDSYKFLLLFEVCSFNDVVVSVLGLLVLVTF
ncbi:hypothetical protein UlMin_037565 [Ulmus minor]